MNTISKQTTDGMRQYLSDDDFNAELDKLVKQEMDYLLENPTDGVIPKIFTIMSKDGKPNGELERAIVMMVNPDFEDSQKKFDTFQAMGYKFAEDNRNVIAVFQISEAWVSQQEKNESGEFMRPSEDPNRAEAIIVAGLTVDGRSNFSATSFEKVTDKKVIFTKTPQVFKYDPDAKNQEFQNNLLGEFFKGYLKGMAPKVMSKELGLTTEELLRKIKNDTTTSN